MVRVSLIRHDDPVRAYGPAERSTGDTDDRPICEDEEPADAGRQQPWVGSLATDQRSKDSSHETSPRRVFHRPCRHCISLGTRADCRAAVQRCSTVGHPWRVSFARAARQRSAQLSVHGIKAVERFWARRSDSILNRPGEHPVWSRKTRERWEPSTKPVISATRSSL